LITIKDKRGDAILFRPFQDKGIRFIGKDEFDANILILFKVFSNIFSIRTAAGSEDGYISS